MNNDISPATRARLIETATAEGISVDALIEHLIDQHEELAALLENADAKLQPASLDQLQAKIEKGFAQSERNEVVDGETFAGRLLAELSDIERDRRAG
jgi:hypothetical protein